MTDSRPRLRIAQLIESDGPGGAEMMLLQLCLELRRRGHFVAPVGPTHGTGWLAGQLQKHDMELHHFHLRRAVDPGCYRGLKELMQRLEIDVMHSHEFTMAVYGAAAARSIGKRHVITLHGGQRMLERWRRRVATRWAIRNSAAAVGVSGATAAVFSRRLGLPLEQFEVIPNGIAVQPGVPGRVRAELGIDERELLIVAVGNVMAVKGHLTLVQALAGFVDSALPWRLVIAGEPRDAAPPILALAAQRGLSDRISLLGRRDDIPDLLAAADIFAMPSLSEGLPIALLEAMFAGRAVVASSVGGIPEVIADGRDGLLVPAADPAALGRALTRLLGDRPLALRLGQAAAARAVAHYGVAAMADAYERLYYGVDAPGGQAGNLRREGTT